jgi:hypothetical protein
MFLPRNDVVCNIPLPLWIIYKAKFHLYSDWMLWLIFTPWTHKYNITQVGFKLKFISCVRYVNVAENMMEKLNSHQRRTHGSDRMPKENHKVTQINTWVLVMFFKILSNYYNPVLPTGTERYQWMNVYACFQVYSTNHKHILEIFVSYLSTHSSA